MSVVTQPVEERLERLELNWEERPGLLGWLTTVDHKRIGLMYLFATLAFYLFLIYTAPFSWRDATATLPAP